MPKLIVFAPCQKALIDRHDNSLSIIGVMHSLILPVPEGEVIPDNVAIGLQWGVGSVWLQTPGDEEKTFEQQIEIIDPNGKRGEGHSIIQFKMTQRTHHIAISGQAFPIGVPGDWRVVVSIREQGQGDWKIAGDYSVQVKHKFVKPEDLDAELGIKEQQTAP